MSDFAPTTYLDAPFFYLIFDNFLQHPCELEISKFQSILRTFTSHYRHFTFLFFRATLFIICIAIASHHYKKLQFICKWRSIYCKRMKIFLFARSRYCLHKFTYKQSLDYKHFAICVIWNEISKVFLSDTCYVTLFRPWIFFILCLVYSCYS